MNSFVVNDKITSFVALMLKGVSYFFPRKLSGFHGSISNESKVCSSISLHPKKQSFTAIFISSKKIPLPTQRDFYLQDN